MALRDGNLFYFLFSPADQARIDATHVTVEDAPHAAVPGVGAPYPQSMRIRVRLTAPGLPPRVRPIGPGFLSFVAASAEGSRTVLPMPGEVDFTAYHTWRTRGALRLDVDPYVLERLMTLTGLPVVPNVFWYEPVDLTSTFLSQALAGLRPPKPMQGRKPIAAPPASAVWIQHATSGFLRGRYVAQVVSAPQAAGDSQAIVEMPSLAPIAPGSLEYELRVTCAFDRTPHDGEYKDYAVADGVTAFDPAHPRHGAVPARLVYGRLRAPSSGPPLIDGDPGQAVADALRVPTPSGHDYYAFRFTRVWKPIADVSVHFPSQVVEITPAAPGSAGAAIAQRLPSHGVLWIARTPIEALVGARLTLRTPADQPVREMRWLAGGTPEVFRDVAEADTPLQVLPLPSPADAAAIPHIVMRRRMSQEVIYDRKYRPTGSVCTYFSLRRVVRALVNNRIAGGRLNFEVYYTRQNGLAGEQDEITETLVREALGGDGNRVLGGAPSHRGAAAVLAPTLRPVLARLFPDVVAPQPGPGAEPTESEGRAAYAVWQSMYPEFQDHSTRRNYDPDWRGGGGPGAMLVLRCAAGYAVHPNTTLTRSPSEADVAFRSRIVGAMLTPGTLQPGAVLQFWVEFSSLQKLRAGTVPAGANLVGHSPIFSRYEGDAANPTGIWVLDQNAQEALCTPTGAAGARALPWGGYVPDVWIASNWTE